MAINIGVNVSKLNAYSALSANAGVNVTKINAYAILAPPPIGVQVSKVNAYAVLVQSVPPVLPDIGFRKLTLPLQVIVQPNITWK